MAVVVDVTIVSVDTVCVLLSSASLHGRAGVIIAIVYVPHIVHKQNPKIAFTFIRKNRF